MSDDKDWSKVDDDDLDDAVADGDDGAMCESGLRQARELHDARARLATLEARIAELTRERDRWAGTAGAFAAEAEADARAERDEAVELLRDDAWPMLVGNVTPESIVALRLPGVSALGRIAAYLARLAPAPEKA